MIRQDENKFNEKVRTAHNNFLKTKLYDLESEGVKEATRVVPNALGEFKDQIFRSNKYCSIRTNRSNWIVRVANVRSETTNVQLVPIFLRFRIVKYDTLTGFHCTCPFTHMYGIPCRHVIHVIKLYAVDVYNFTHHDFDIRWWTTYANIVALKDPEALDNTEKTIREELVKKRLYEVLHVGKKVVVQTFHAETYRCGSSATELLQHLSLREAKDLLFCDSTASRPVNYTGVQIESVLSSFSQGVDGIRKTFVLSYNSENNDGVDNGDEIPNTTETIGLHTSDGLQIDFANRDVVQLDSSGGTVQAKKSIDHFKEMLSVNKELWSMLENCKDEYFYEIKKRTEEANKELMRDVRLHVMSNTKQINTSKGPLLSCLPINTVNTTNEHKRQNIY